MKKNTKLSLNEWLQTYQILTNNNQMPVFRLSYFITVERTLLPIYALTMIEY